jgi:hypothetical protein
MKVKVKREAMQNVDGQLWQLAVENVEGQQEEYFQPFIAAVVAEHLEGDCRDCEHGLCSRCKDRIISCVKDWQEGHCDGQVEAEYDRLAKQQDEWLTALGNIAAMLGTSIQRRRRGTRRQAVGAQGA